MKPYLIQRAKFQDNPNRKGIDSILDFDYMGSAEFEFGALPQSLKRIRENMSNYCISSFDINNKKISIFYDNKLIESPKELSEIIEGLADNKFCLKEYCDFQHFIYFNPLMLKCDFWWDIENDYMFWKYNEEFNNKFIKLIKPGGKNG